MSPLPIRHEDFLHPINVSYDFTTVFTEEVRVALNRTQEIEVIFEPPLWIMSPRIRVYRAEQVKKFQGYLYPTSFTPPGVAEGESPEAVITIEVTGEAQQS